VEIDSQLDSLLREWTQSLLDNLEDPTIKEKLHLLKPNQQQLLNEFLQSETLPDPLTNEFIHAVQEVLSGLVKVIVKQEDLRTVLLTGGSPCTISEMKKRFEDYLNSLAKGQEGSKVRIVIE
jgi:succinate dehydrogenase flavin-adding protein (antitoxin of CptAB toxin-antitoxin module)